MPKPDIISESEDHNKVNSSLKAISKLGNDTFSIIAERDALYNEWKQKITLVYELQGINDLLADSIKGSADIIAKQAKKLDQRLPKNERKFEGVLAEL